MNNKNKLVLGQGLFIMFVIVSFGLIVMNEKGGAIFSSKIEKEITIYLEENYSNIINNIKLNPIEYSKRKFKVKVESKKNKNYYFNITYNKGKISDSYSEDYEKGKTLLTHIEKKLEKDIYNKTNIKCKISPLSSLDSYTEKLQDRIIKEENLLELSFYTIEKEIIISNWNSNDIVKEIDDFIETIESNNINPKYYKIIITKEDDITYSIEINNITKDFFNNKNKIKIIENILNDNDKDNILEENKITYKYLN